MSRSSNPLADLSPDEKRVLLSKLLEKKRQEPKSFPLSFSQEAIWFFEQLQPGSALFNIPTAFRMSGRMDVGLAERIINEIVRRHEALRTTITVVDGKPLQRIAPNLRIPLSAVDLRAFSPPEQEEKVRALAAEEGRQPFDLSRGPLFRVTLLRLGEEEHLILVTMHHIISDGWSVGVFFREAAALYGVFSMGLPSPLPPLPIQFGDFVVWQRQWLREEALEPKIAYWRRQLAGLPVLELATDHLRAAVQSFRGATEFFVLPDSLSEGLRSLSVQEGVTLFMTLLAAFQTLLYRYTGQEDVVVGAATAGRNRPEVEDLIGLFANALVLRTDLSGNPRFRELLRRVNVMCMEAYAHDDVPFEKLVEALQPKRDLRWAPLFRVMFRVIPTMAAIEAPFMTVTPVERENGTTGFDLLLSITDTGGGGLRGSFVYSTDLFEAGSVRRMAAHFRALLEGIVARPDETLSSLPCLEDVESRQLLAKRRSLRSKGPLDQLEEIEDLTNLTRDQLLLWAGQKLQPDAPLYNLAAIFTIRKTIDREHFRSAFQTLVNSSDALRTVIEEIDGVPQRSVVADFPCTVEYLDFSLSPDPDGEVRTWARKRSQARFDLAKSLLDCVLIKLSNERFIWYLNQHHMIADAWSVWLIADRMAELYDRSLKGRLEERVGLPAFEDYVKDEREYRVSSRHRKDEAYWNQKLAQKPEPIAFYGKTPVKQTTAVRRVSCSLGFERTQKLRAVAAQEGIFAGTRDASLFNIFAALLCAYLYRISGNPSIVFGTPFHNRRSRAFKKTIGLFVKVLPLHVELERRDTFLSIIKKVRAETFETLRHGEAAIKNPLDRRAYDVVLNYHNMSRPDFNGAPMETEAVHTGHQNESFSLRIVDFNQAGNFTLEFDFHCDVFDEALRGQAIQQFLRVLDAFLQNPSQSLSRLSLVTAEERERVLVGFNHSDISLPEKRTIAQLFEAQVERAPDAVAVVFEDQQLTYRELNRRANQLAHHLQKLEVGPEVLVGACMERSLEMVVGLLGILKTGGACLPLDPAHPKERLAFMLEDSRARVLVAHQRLAAELSAQRGWTTEDGDCRIPVVSLDMDSIIHESEENPASLATAGNVAYVIYTSGSTGKPKGIVVSHGSIASHCVEIQRHYELDFSDRVLQFASLSFDASLEQIFAALLSGARLILRGADVWTARDLHKKVLDFGLTVANLPTAYWQQVALEWGNSPQLGPNHQLKLVIVGGDVMPLESLKLRQQSPFCSVRLLNAYGPTETTITATTFEIPPGFCRDASVKRIPIGRPLPNRAIYILETEGNLAPIGVPGELYIGGRGLARGYLNRPDLTAEKFVPNPFSKEPGARLYKTGDLARYLPDGNIEFVGRIDDQVKIRGFRIEPGEIEAVLRQHPGVRETVVMAREQVSEDPAAMLRAGPSTLLRTGKRLVAYVVPGDEAPGSTELRNFLKKKLPESMVPAEFVILDSLPLTVSGKVDRRSLPAPEQSASGPEKTFIAPRTPAEEALAGIWADLLGVGRVSVEDEFFDLGGHSLLAIQLLERVREIFGVELALRQVFEAPTVAEMARAIEIARQALSSVAAHNDSQGGESSRPASLISEMTVATLNAEAVLDPAICPRARPVEEITERASIFLTGATGFLGAFLLHELLKTTRADIHCLVRSPDPAEGKRRIRKNLEFYSLWDENQSHRILSVPGDLSRPYLGLSLERFRILAAQIDIIYHNGALVNFMYPYRAHKPSNVLGTQEMLRLAGEIKLKPVHHVSTTSVFQGIDRMSALVGEQDDLDQTGAPSGGYAQSKWVAEKLVMIAGSRGLPVAIYRPGLLSGHSQSGIWNADDFIVNILRACVELGKVPDLDAWVDLAPVDYVSQAIVHLSKQRESCGKIFHVVNPSPIRSRDLLNCLDSFGYRLQRISFDDWRNLLSNLAEYVQKTSWAPLLHVLKTIERDGILVPRVQCKNTLAGLAGSSIACPPVGPELLTSYLSYFVRRGFIKPPKSGFNSFKEFQSEVSGEHE